MCLSRPYYVKFFKGCLPQVLLGSFLNTLSHIFVYERVYMWITFVSLHKWKARATKMSDLLYSGRLSSRLTFITKMCLIWQHNTS